MDFSLNFFHWYHNRSDRTHPIEMFVAVCTGLLGLRFVLPLDNLSKYPSCMGMLTLMPAWAWGATLITTSTIHILITVFGTIGPRKLAAFWSFVLRLSIALIMIRLAPFDPAATAHFCVAGASLWSYWRLQPNVNMV